MPVTLADVRRARECIAPYVRHTPLIPSSWLSETTGGRVSLKLESLQVSNSFKSRGAYNAVIARLERGQPRELRLVTASAGNHGRALAGAAQTFMLPLVVFTPADAPRTKLTAIRRHGAELRAEGRDYDDAERLAKAFASETGAQFISPYNDLDVIAGAATVALEIFEDAPDANTLVVPVGGGGLISGVAMAARALNAAVDVIGVEVEASRPFQTSLLAGRLVPIVPGPTLADGLAGNPDPDTITFDFIRRFVNRMLTVTEEDLTDAVVGLVESERVIAEGAGAAAVAALSSRRVEGEGLKVVAIVSGANIDRAKLATLLTSG